jgi:hypothetical protein
MSFGGIGRLLWSVVAGPKTFRPRQRIPPAAKIIRLPFKPAPPHHDCRSVARLQLFGYRQSNHHVATTSVE